MFIKTQDGKAIIPVTEPIYKARVPTADTNWWDWGGKKCKYNYTIECKNFNLGEYTTKEQRDKVWDDIWFWLEDKYSNIFIMPKSRDRDEE